MASEKQLAAMARAREARATNKREQESATALAAETTEIIEEYVQEAHEEGIEEPLPPVRNRVIRNRPSSRAPVPIPKPAVRENPPLELIRKIALTSGRGGYHFVIDLEEGTWECKATNAHGELVFRGDGPVLRIDMNEMTRSIYGHIEREAHYSVLDISRYNRVADIEEEGTTIRETRSAYETAGDENDLFADDEDGNVAFSLEEDGDDGVIDLSAEDDDDLPDVSIKTFYDERDDADVPILSDDGDDSGDLVDPELLEVMDEVDADLVDIRDLHDDTSSESENEDEDDDDGYYDSTLKPPNPLKG